MKDDALAIAYFWEPVTLVTGLAFALLCLAVAGWLIYELKTAPKFDEKGNPITPQPRPDPKSPDRRTKGNDQ
ncbi:hypothetical protein [Salmonirosea aquatica]|uniref:Uncharacterized protein n=1 Tax=Salmonirosea aquatica TaxID=2654236 RepID=A0A7C9FZL3_9BACT|nr:hypothetical protein [Cytophagaceae bacterium SJW1-29]